MTVRTRRDRPLRSRPRRPRHAWNRPVPRAWPAPNAAMVFHRSTFGLETSEWRLFQDYPTMRNSRGPAHDHCQIRCDSVDPARGHGEPDAVVLDPPSDVTVEHREAATQMVNLRVRSGKAHVWAAHAVIGVGDT